MRRLSSLRIVMGFGSRQVLDLITCSSSQVRLRQSPGWSVTTASLRIGIEALVVAKPLEEVTFECELSDRAQHALPFLLRGFLQP
jgi:hypothetical protein